MTEAEILTEIITPDSGGMTVEAAQSVLSWQFSPAARDRMVKLLESHNRGELAEAELAELDRFRRVGMLLDLLQAKARQSLRQAQAAG